MQGGFLKADYPHPRRAEAAALLKLHGPNELAQKTKSKLLLFLEQARPAPRSCPRAQQQRRSSVAVSPAPVAARPWLC